MTKLKIVGILAASFILQACATSPNQSVRDTTPTSDENIHLWYEMATPLVANELNIALSSVPIEIQGKGEMYLTHKELLEESIDTNFHKKSRQEILKHQIKDSLSSIIALYDPNKKRIVIDRKNFVDHVDRLKERGHSTKQAALTVILHELVHAADDARYDLNALHESSSWNSLERSAVLEGHAQFITQKICEEHNCKEAFDDDEQYLRYLPSLTGTAKLFPNRRGDNIALRYVQGANFIRDLHEMENGKELVDNALRQAPGDVLSLFETSRFLDDNINSSSQKLAQVLASEEAQWLSKWIKVPRASFTQSSFPRRSDRREEFVSERSRHLLGSAMTSYYPPGTSKLLPITIRLLETRNTDAAEEEASFMLSEVRRNTSGMLGWSTSLRNIKSWQEKTSIAGEPAHRRHFSADLLNTETGTTTWYRATITNYRNKISEVSSFKPNVTHNKALAIADNLLQKVTEERKKEPTLTL